MNRLWLAVVVVGAVMVASLWSALERSPARQLPACKCCKDGCTCDPVKGDLLPECECSPCKCNVTCGCCRD